MSQISSFSLEFRPSITTGFTFPWEKTHDNMILGGHANFLQMGAADAESDDDSDTHARTDATAAVTEIRDYAARSSVGSDPADSASETVASGSQQDPSWSPWVNPYDHLTHEAKGDAPVDSAPEKAGVDRNSSEPETGADAALAFDEFESALLKQHSGDAKPVSTVTRMVPSEGTTPAARDSKAATSTLPKVHSLPLENTGSNLAASRVEERVSRAESEGITTYSTHRKSQQPLKGSWSQEEQHTSTGESGTPHAHGPAAVQEEPRRRGDYRSRAVAPEMQERTDNAETHTSEAGPSIKNKASRFLKNVIPTSFQKHEHAMPKSASAQSDMSATAQDNNFTPKAKQTPKSPEASPLRSLRDRLLPKQSKTSGHADSLFSAPLATTPVENVTERSSFTAPQQARMSIDARGSAPYAETRSVERDTYPVIPTPSVPSRGTPSAYYTTNTPEQFETFSEAREPNRQSFSFAKRFQAQSKEKHQPTKGHASKSASIFHVFKKRPAHSSSEIQADDSTVQTDENNTAEKSGVSFVRAAPDPSGQLPRRKPTDETVDAPAEDAATTPKQSARSEMEPTLEQSRNVSLDQITSHPDAPEHHSAEDAEDDLPLGLSASSLAATKKLEEDPVALAPKKGGPLSSQRGHHTQETAPDSGPKAAPRESSQASAPLPGKESGETLPSFRRPRHAIPFQSSSLPSQVEEVPTPATSTMSPMHGEGSLPAELATNHAIDEDRLSLGFGDDDWTLDLNFNDAVSSRAEAVAHGKPNASASRNPFLASS